MGTGRTLLTILRRLLIVLILVAVFIFSAATTMLYVFHGTETRVPSVVGMTEIRAREEVKKQGLQLEVVAKSYDDKAPANEIIEQNPKEGTIVKEGFPVRVKISLGKRSANQ